MVAESVYMGWVATANDNHIRGAIEVQLAGTREQVQVLTPEREWQTASRPILCHCSDGKRYVIKPSRGDKQPVNDCIFGNIGIAIGAPIPPIALAFVDPRLTASPGLLFGVQEGLAHASLFDEDADFVHALPDCGNSANELRVRRLALFFGLCAGDDPQFLYQRSGDRLVFSHDHGHFCNLNWTEASLATLGEPSFFSGLESVYGMTDDQREHEVRSLVHLADDTLVQILGLPPENWFITLNERVAMVKTIAARRDKMIEKYS